ncbi:MAG: hypothetical protein ACFB51_01640 [Anaerolineae bacterium]
MQNKTLWQRFTAFMGWNRTSYAMFGAFLLTCGVIVYVWWPLAEEYIALIMGERGDWWNRIDWLLIGIWLVMSLLIMWHADLRRDLPIVFVGLAGGLVIESWGTQTELWSYYTLERPPLWIIPAWPVAGLSVDRIVRMVEPRVPAWRRGFEAAYWLIFPTFFALMLIFVWPTIGKSLTVASLVLCALLIATPTDHRVAVITFLSGAGLGIFLELWGTTRLCWTYYTLEQPPLFAVLAHGMAAIAFWRVTALLAMLWRRIRPADRTAAATD